MLKPIDNGEYLHEKLSKYTSIGDYELTSRDVVAVFVESVSPANFIAKFQFPDLYKCVRKLNANHNINYPVRVIREADSKDDNMYYSFEDSLKTPTVAPNSAIAGIQKPLHEKKFNYVVILGECDEDMLRYIKDDENAMDMYEVLPNSGVYRKID